MTVTQYIGSRYVPLFADPLEWDIKKTYEPLTIVLYQGNSYTSRQAVPADIDITNESYWAQTGNYNAQIEQYRQETQAVSQKAEENAQDIITNSADISALEADLTTETNNRTSGDTTLDNKITSVSNRVDVIEDQLDKKECVAILGDSFTTGASWVTEFASKTGVDVINKAVNGAAFYTQTGSSWTTIGSQWNAVKADTKFSDVTRVIIYGGVNDWNNEKATMGQTATAIQNLVNSIRNDGIEDIYICFGNIGFAQQTQYNGFESWYNNVCNILKTSGYPIIENVPYWHFLISSCFNTDNLHPNAKGNTIIADFMYKIFMGTYTGVNRAVMQDSLTDYFLGGNTACNCCTKFNNGTITLDIRLNQSLEIAPPNDGDVRARAGYFLPQGSQVSCMIGKASQMSIIPSKYIYMYAGSSGFGIIDLLCDFSQQEVLIHFAGQKAVIPGGKATINNGVGAMFTGSPTVFA